MVFLSWKKAERAFVWLGCSDQVIGVVRWAGVSEWLPAELAVWEVEYYQKDRQHPEY